jgi:hypothetical protein
MERSVLREFKPRSNCPGLHFAPGADAESRSGEELCAEVARVLRRQGASWQKLLVSTVVAAAAGRYDAMIHAMHEVGIEQPMIEDLVRYGHQRGLEQGLREGQERGLREGRTAMRESLLELLALRGLSPTAEEASRIEAEPDIDRLRQWFRRAARADSVRDVFAE